MRRYEFLLQHEATASLNRYFFVLRFVDAFYPPLIQAETINRLLKKQSRPRGKRNALATADDRTPTSRPNTGVAGTPEDDDESAEPSEPVVQEPPTYWRWISTTKLNSTNGGANVAGSKSADAEGDDNKMAVDEEPEGESIKAEKTMTLSFSVPVSMLPPPSKAEGHDHAVTDMDVDGTPAALVKTKAKTTPPSRPPTNGNSLCDVEGCGQTRKYRLVKDWTRGACGMEHLKALQVK